MGLQELKGKKRFLNYLLILGNVKVDFTVSMKSIDVVMMMMMFMLMLEK